MASEAKHTQVQTLAPDAILSRNPADLKSALFEATGKDTVTVVADIVGGDYFPTIIDVLVRGGRYTCSGAIAGPMVNMDMRDFYLKDLHLIGCTAWDEPVFPNLVGYIERGEIIPLLAKTFAFEDIASAQQQFLQKAHFGNFVLLPP